LKKEISIYESLPIENGELCHPIDHVNFERIINELNGSSRKNTWESIKVEIIHEDEGVELLETDSPWLGSHALIFKTPAIQVLGQLLNEHGELLPLICDETELYIYNVTEVLDALDETRSTVVRFSTGRIMTIERYSFRKDIIDDRHIFKLPNLRASPIFVSHDFVQLWELAGLRGLQFNKVWSG